MGYPRIIDPTGLTQKSLNEGVAECVKPDLVARKGIAADRAITSGDPTQSQVGRIAALMRPRIASSRARFWQLAFVLLNEL